MNSKKATIYDYARFLWAHCFVDDNCDDECAAFPLKYLHCGIEKADSEELTKINEIILKWCEEHPIKTRQSEFLKMFPNAKIDNCGIPIFCPRWVDKDFKCNRERLSCDACEKEYWLAEVEENGE